jgi:hypothetical protein
VDRDQDRRSRGAEREAESGWSDSSCALKGTTINACVPTRSCFFMR